VETVEHLLKAFDRNRPVLLVDADEVLLRFVERLERYFLSQNFELRLTSFQLSGNTYHKGSGDLAQPNQVQKLIAGFFEACVDDVDPVPGAAEGLAELSEHFQIAVLSNVPKNCRERREKSLAALDLGYPVIANKGDKGPVVKRFDEAFDKLTVFVDDLPPQHTSVAEHSPESHRVHFVADTRLAKMIGKAPDAHVRLDRWQDVTPHLIDLLKD